MTSDALHIYSQSSRVSPLRARARACVCLSFPCDTWLSKYVCKSFHLMFRRRMSFSVTMQASSLPSKPFNSIAKPTIRLRTDFKLKLAKQKMEDEERRRRQTATMSSSVQSTSGQSVFLPVTLSSSLNDSSRSSVGQVTTRHCVHYLSSHLYTQFLYSRRKVAEIWNIIFD